MKRELKMPERLSDAKYSGYWGSFEIWYLERIIYTKSMNKLWIFKIKRNKKMFRTLNCRKWERCYLPDYLIENIAKQIKITEFNKKIKEIICE